MMAVGEMTRVQIAGKVEPHATVTAPCSLGYLKPDPSEGVV